MQLRPQYCGAYILFLEPEEYGGLIPEALSFSRQNPITNERESARLAHQNIVSAVFSLPQSDDKTEKLRMEFRMKNQDDIVLQQGVAEAGVSDFVQLIELHILPYLDKKGVQNILFQQCAVGSEAGSPIDKASFVQRLRRWIGQG